MKVSRRFSSLRRERSRAPCRAGMLRGRLLRLLVVAAAPVLVAAGLDPLQDALATIRAQELRSHVAFLSHDVLRGRAPGTRGGAVAAQYIATQYMHAGVEPPRGGFMRPVPLVGATTLPQRASLAFAHDDLRVEAAPRQDAVVWPTTDSVASVEAELVFVGYGIDAPEYDWDDYGDADLRGRIALVLVNDPPAPPEEPALFDGRGMTWYGRWSYKLEELRRRGAAGVLLVHSDAAAGYPWSVVLSSWTGEQLRLAQAPPGRLEVAGWITRPFAADVLALAQLDLTELLVRAARRDFQPIRTGIAVRIHAEAGLRRFTAPNVVGILPGSDQELRDEAVLYVAHYDHLGVRAGADGDSIYNGAYDNASGVAALLEVAEAAAAMSPRPRRSLIFLATTAEEAGMLGAQHYVQQPVLPIGRTVAVINIDGANLWGETEDVTGLGSERSTLGDVLAEQARSMDMELVAERAPGKGFFFRSDHFPFARAGVPAFQLEHGTRFRGRPDSWGNELLREYESERYHRPADELEPDMSFAGMVQQARLALRVGVAVAQQDERPRWYPGGRVVAEE